MRRLIFIIVSIAVSGLFLWLALRDVPLDLVFTAIGRANLFWIIVSALSVTLALFLRGVRWKVLLGGKMTLMQCAHIFNVGMLVNQLPLRAGELVRIVIATRYQVPVLTSAASIIVERLLDVVMVVIVLAIGLARAPFVPEGTGRTAIAFSALAVVGFAVLIGFARFPAIPRRIVRGLNARIPALHRFNLEKRVDETLAGLLVLTHWRVAVGAVGWTLIGWAVSIGTYYTLLLAFDVSGLFPNVDPLAMSCLGVSLASLGVALPLTLAGIGPFQGGSRVAGELMGLDAVVSAALGIVFHGVTVLNYTFWGVVGLLALGVSYGDLVKAQQQAEAPAAASASDAT
jgi:uncharacterized protein (TIRG00374 family)